MSGYADDPSLNPRPMDPRFVLLQALLGLPTPQYRHHPLLTDPEGKRLAKRDRALSIRAMRQAGMTPAEVVAAAR